MLFSLWAGLYIFWVTFWRVDNSLWFSLDQLLIAEWVASALKFWHIATPFGANAATLSMERPKFTWSQNFVFLLFWPKCINPTIPSHVCYSSLSLSFLSLYHSLTHSLTHSFTHSLTLVVYTVCVYSHAQCQVNQHLWLTCKEHVSDLHTTWELLANYGSTTSSC